MARLGNSACALVAINQFNGKPIIGFYVSFAKMIVLALHLGDFFAQNMETYEATSGNMIKI